MCPLICLKIIFHAKFLKAVVVRLLLANFILNFSRSLLLINRTTNTCIGITAPNTRINKRYRWVLQKLIRIGFYIY